MRSSPFQISSRYSVVKVLEHVVDKLIRQRIEIEQLQCGLMSGRGTTDAIFIVR